jgi:hypothetical protein
MPRKGTGSIVAFVAHASQSGGSRGVLRPAIKWWLFGAVVGITLLGVMMFSPIAFPLAFVVLVVLAVRSPERAAFGGGALIPTGLWFLYALRVAVERCAAANGPRGSCEIYGVPEQAIAMGLYVAIGIGLTAYALVRSRSARA